MGVLHGRVEEFVMSTGTRSPGSRSMNPGCDKSLFN